MRTHLGDKSDIELILHHVDVQGLTLLDIGCGSGGKTRLLAEHEATVTGIEPDPIQATDR
jgi:cyclopropane fatty-acyl-phospholipid synthase-like methyltransferase